MLISSFNKKIKDIFTISFGFSLAFIVLEIFFRIIPASDYFVHKKPIICKNLAKLDLDCFRTRKKFIKGRFIKGKLPKFTIDSIKSTNNLGQFSDINFDKFEYPDPNAIQIISIGDSYVEAIQVDNNESFHGLLNQSIYYNDQNNYLNINSTAFGSSGYAFPSFLKIYEYLIKDNRYFNDLTIFTVNANDFDGSYSSRRISERGSFFFKKDTGNIYFVDYLSNPLIKTRNFFIKNSALTRYLIFNLQISQYAESYPLCKIWSPCKKKIYVANVFEESLQENPKRYNHAYNSTRLFIDKLNQLNPDKSTRKNIIFLVDADRVSIFKGIENKKSFFNLQRNYFIKHATENGYSTIDLEKLFKKDFELNKKKLFFKNDSHWNQQAHRIVAKSINNLISKFKYKNKKFLILNQ